MIFVFAYIKKKQTATRKYDISSKLNFSVNDAGLPELAQLSVPQRATKTEHRQPFNPDYMTDGKINKTKLFAYILPEKKQMTWQQLRAVVMNVMNIESSSFADKLLHEALDESAIRLVEDEHGHKQYANAQQTSLIF